ncbi:MAG TPA: hypothetical protein VE225_06430, partial [Rubrobacteraceae bacterium]|nr:hypothetical protein [Rubrobacteraceae bacterium]
MLQAAEELEGGADNKENHEGENLDFEEREGLAVQTLDKKLSGLPPRTSRNPNSLTEKAAHPLSPEQLTDQRRPSDVRASPDGGWAVFVVRPFAKEAEHPVSDLWILPLPEGVPRRFTSGDWLDEAPRPSPDGSRLAFLSDRAERGEKNLYVIPIDGGEALRIFDEQGDVSEPSWSPDGRFIAVLFTEPESQEEKERRKRREDAKVWDTDYRYRRLWVVDAESLEARPVSPEDRQVWGYAWSPDGEWLAINTTA